MKPPNPICILLLAFVMLLIGLTPDIAMACPSCKNALHMNGAATGYAISILFMMIMPFAIFTFWTVLILRLRRQMSDPSGPETASD